jgi:PrcB C-terminal
LRSRSQLHLYLERYGSDRRPAVDFDRHQLLLVSPGPRSSTGYELRVEDVRDKGGRIVVTVRERTPRLGDRVAARVTFPYRLLVLPAGKDVYVDWKGR